MNNNMMKVALAEVFGTFWLALGGDVAARCWRRAYRDNALADLCAQTEHLSGQLATARQALNRAEDAKQSAHRETRQAQDELRHLTLLNHALSVKADVVAIAGAPVSSGTKTAVSKELEHMKARLAEQKAAYAATNEEAARLKKTLENREAQISA